MSLPRAKAGPRARHCSLWREARAGWGQPLRVEAGSQVHTTTPSSCTARWSFISEPGSLPQERGMATWCPW